MESSEMKVALRTGRIVTWVGKLDQERASGTLTAIIYRFVGGEYLLSGEITDSLGRKTICRADELDYWKP